jgi:hypothetical protein
MALILPVPTVIVEEAVADDDWAHCYASSLKKVPIS